MPGHLGNFPDTQAFGKFHRYPDIWGISQIPILIKSVNAVVTSQVSISCSDKEVKLVTGSKGQERLTRLCSATGGPFPFMNKGKQIDKVGKKYVQVLTALWKAENKPQEVMSVNQMSEVMERKLWAGEKVVISAGSAKIVKVRTVGNWKGQGFMESIPREEQEAGQKLVLPENI